MSNFEKQLASALARQEPPAHFTGRVLEAVERGKHKQTFWKRWFAQSRRPILRLAPGLAAALIVSGGAYFEQHQQAERGEAAKQQLLTAMRIASEKFYSTEQRVILAGD
jgi:hypothetical protein